MSLQIAAQHLASRGRGPDTQLVHMAPQEVAGLNALARAHGGSLTTNPDTGLPEAGFLSKLLPTLIGAGLSIASGGTLTPMMAAMLTGGGYGLATGSLKKGLMAGLGAYGGAGLMGGLSAAGTAAAGAESVVNPLTGMEAATLENAAVAPAAGVEVGAPIVDSANLSQTGPNLFGSPGTPTLTAAPAAVAPPPPPQPQPQKTDHKQPRLKAKKEPTLTDHDAPAGSREEYKRTHHASRAKPRPQTKQQPTSNDKPPTTIHRVEKDQPSRKRPHSVQL